MGNCCKTQNDKPQEEPKQPPPQPKITIVLDEASNKLDIPYNPQTTLQHIINIVNESTSLLQSTNFSIQKNSLEILEFSATLLELGIYGGETITIKTLPDMSPSEETAQKHLRIQTENICEGSLEEIAEEESTTKHEIGQVKPRLNGRHSNAGAASSLWKTAMPSPSAKGYLNFEKLDLSSNNNTQDYSIKEKNFSSQLNFNLKMNGQSVLVESDQSINPDSSKLYITKVRHPTDFFRDLQGPFSVLKFN